MAATKWSACRCCGVAIRTASIDLSSSKRPVVLERRDAGDDRLRFIEPSGVNVRHRDGFDIGAPQRGLQDLLAPRAAADQAEPDSIVRPQDPARGRGSPVAATAAPAAPPIIDPRKARRWDMACLLQGAVAPSLRRPRTPRMSLYSTQPSTQSRCSPSGGVRSRPMGEVQRVSSGKLQGPRRRTAVPLAPS